MSGKISYELFSEKEEALLKKPIGDEEYYSSALGDLNIYPLRPSVKWINFAVDIPKIGYTYLLTVEGIYVLEGIESNAPVKIDGSNNYNCLNYLVTDYGLAIFTATNILHILFSDPLTVHVGETSISGAFGGVYSNGVITHFSESTKLQMISVGENLPYSAMTQTITNPMGLNSSCETNDAVYIVSYYFGYIDIYYRFKDSSESIYTNSIQSTTIPTTSFVGCYAKDNKLYIVTSNDNGVYYVSLDANGNVVDNSLQLLRIDFYGVPQNMFKDNSGNVYVSVFRGIDLDANNDSLIFAMDKDSNTFEERYSMKGSLNSIDLRYENFIKEIIDTGEYVYFSLSAAMSVFTANTGVWRTKDQCRTMEKVDTVNNGYVLLGGTFTENGIFWGGKGHHFSNLEGNYAKALSLEAFILDGNYEWKKFKPTTENKKEEENKTVNAENIILDRGFTYREEASTGTAIKLTTEQYTTLKTNGFVDVGVDRIYTNYEVSLNNQSLVNDKWASALALANVSLRKYGDIPGGFKRYEIFNVVSLDQPFWYGEGVVSSQTDGDHFRGFEAMICVNNSNRWIVACILPDSSFFLYESTMNVVSPKFKFSVVGTDTIVQSRAITSFVISNVSQEIALLRTQVKDLFNLIDKIQS